jgi:glycosyltransferase involved in cell wall biosynthesis
VLHVVASINREVGGPALTVPRLAATLSGLGLDTMIATLDYARHGPRSAVSGARVEAIAANGLARGLRGWSPALSRRLRALAERDADIVHNHGLWMFPNYYARKAAAAGRIPLVLSPRGMLDEWSLRRSRVRKALAWRLVERNNLAAAALFHATSTTEAQAIRAARMTQPIAVIPNGVDLPAPGEIAPRERLESRFAGLRGKHWLLFLSRLHPKKGVAELLRAWHALRGRWAEWHLVVAGPDTQGHGKAMRRLAADLGLAERATFVGMLAGEEKACALAHAELFVLPTHAENFGVVVAEALAHGTPVITTSAAPWAELREARCGWWIEDREDALCSALEAALLLSPEEREAMGERGRALVAARYSWDRAGREMRAAYDWLRGSGPRPGCVLPP